MKNLLISTVFFFLALPLSAKILISPIEVMHQNFGSAAQISKKNILLTSAQAKKIQKSAKSKLKNKIVRVFKAKRNDKIVGYGILIDKKVRTKNVIALYLVSADSILKSVEIIAFNEPLEYIPSKTWMSQFEDTPAQKRLVLSKEIPTITGATMSARSLVDGSRLALAFYDAILKGKE